MAIAGLLDFYNLLFSVEITLFGIVCAVMLVFVQIVHSYYSYRNVPHILRDKLVYFFVGTGVLSIAMALTASFSLSIKKHNFVPEIDFNTHENIVNTIYPAVCLALAVFSSIAFLLFLRKNFAYLQPARALFILAKRINSASINNFLWEKYGVDVPPAIKYRIKEVDSSDAHSLEFEEVKDRSLQLIEKRVNAIRRNFKKVDPFLPLRDMAIQFIQRIDTASLSESANLLTELGSRYISQLAIREPSKTWQPENTLARSYTKNLIELVTTLINVLDVSKLHAFKPIVLDITLNLADDLVEHGMYFEAEELVIAWRKFANESIGDSSDTFIHIMSFLQKFIKKLQEDTPEDHAKGLLDELFRSAGWLGEQLLIRKPISDQPIMASSREFNEFDAIVEPLYEAGHHYQQKNPDGYPLIFFDALYVIIRRLVKLAKEYEEFASQHISILSYEFRVFAREALKVGNSDGAALASTYVYRTYQMLKEAELNKLASDALDSLVVIGIESAGFKHKASKESFLGDLPIWITDKIAKMGENVESGVMEGFLDSGGERNYEEAWAFIRNLGQKMKTNFGLMFDPITGETYGHEDPRRN